MRLIVLSSPGGDARVQALRIAVSLGVPLLDAGELLRAAMTAGTPLGARAQAMMTAGARVPDDIVLGLLAERLGRADAGFILTRYPHDVAQAAALDAMLARLGQQIDAAVQLAGDEDWTREQTDDEVSRAHLDELRARNALLAEYYRARGKLTTLAQLPLTR